MSDTQVKTTIVLAATYQRFLDWCRESHRSPADPRLRYVSDYSDLQGRARSSCDVVVLDGWMQSMPPAEAHYMEAWVAGKLDRPPGTRVVQ